MLARITFLPVPAWITTRTGLSRPVSVLGEVACKVAIRAGKRSDNISAGCLMFGTSQSISVLKVDGHMSNFFSGLLHIDTLQTVGPKSNSQIFRYKLEIRIQT